MAKDIQEFLSAGAEMVLTKPMKADQLDAILRCFEKQSAQKTSEKLKELQQTLGIYGFLKKTD
jgi:hypothetical protein